MEATTGMNKTPIPLTGFAEEPEDLKTAMRAACDRVLGSSTWILGSEVDHFEVEFARTMGVRECVGVGNGMDALEMILRARGVGPGHEVITTPMTAAATVLAIIRAGATPVLADIDPSSGLLSGDSVQRCLTSKTKAIMLVHLYGQMRDLDTWTRLCESNNLELIEDCAQSHGATWRGRPCGTYGVAGAYSFYPTKNLGAVGDAGAIVTNDDGLATDIRVLRNYGQRTRYEHEVVGLNSRLDEMQAAILRARLAYLERFTLRRRSIAEKYRESILNTHVTLLAEPQEPAAHVHHQFVVLTEQRERFQNHLMQQGIPTLVHYPIPAHHQQAFDGVSRDPSGLASSETHAQQCVSLPCHPQLTDADVHRVIEAIESFNP